MRAEIEKLEARLYIVEELLAKLVDHYGVGELGSADWLAAAQRSHTDAAEVKRTGDVVVHDLAGSLPDSALD